MVKGFRKVHYASENVLTLLSRGCPDSFTFNLEVTVCTCGFKPEKMRAPWVGFKVGIE